MIKVNELKYRGIVKLKNLYRKGGFLSRKSDLVERARNKTQL